MGCVEEDDRTVSTGSGSQEKAEAESCRESRNRRRHEEALGCGESGQGATGESCRQETGKEGGGKEVGSEENGPGCCSGRNRNCRSVSEVRQSMGGHGTCLGWGGSEM